jgi:hypothetical protein
MCIWRSTTNPSINCPKVFALKYDLISTACPSQTPRLYSRSDSQYLRLRLPLCVPRSRYSTPFRCTEMPRAHKCGIRIQCRSSARSYGFSHTALVAQHNSNSHHARIPVPRSRYVSTQRLSLSDTPDQARSPLLRGTDAPVGSDTGAKSISGLDWQAGIERRYIFVLMFILNGVVRLSLMIVQNLCYLYINSSTLAPATNIS